MGSQAVSGSSTGKIGLADAPPQRKIHQHRSDDQRHVDRVPPAVEKKRRQREPVLRRLRTGIAGEKAEGEEFKKHDWARFAVTIAASRSALI